jgi:hypothetical protein
MAKDYDDEDPKQIIARLTRIIEDLRETFDDAQSSQRDALFPYLAAVLSVYREMKERKVANKESSKMCEISGVKNRERLRHPIRRIIAATSDVDGKAASKMTSALRYAFHEEWKDVVRKLRKHGGIAGCAKKFSELDKT